MEQEVGQALQQIREEIARLRVKIAKLETTASIYDTEVEQEIRAIEAGALAVATQAAGWRASKITTRSRESRGWLGSLIFEQGQNS